MSFYRVFIMKLLSKGKVVKRANLNWTIHLPPLDAQRQLSSIFNLSGGRHSSPRQFFDLKALIPLGQSNSKTTVYHTLGETAMQHHKIV